MTTTPTDVMTLGERAGFVCGIVSMFFLWAALTLQEVGTGQVLSWRAFALIASLMFALFAAMVVIVWRSK